MITVIKDEFRQDLIPIKRTDKKVRDKVIQQVEIALEGRNLEKALTEIDSLVYEINGLSKKEIQIVEDICNVRHQL